MRNLLSIMVVMIMNNMWLVCKLEFRNRKKTIFVWSMLIAVIMFIYMALFKEFKGALVAEMEVMPPEVLELFNMSKEIDYTKFNNYFSMVSQIILIVMCAFSAYMGSLLLADEQSNKTIEYLNANPVNRKEIILGKALTHLIMIAIVQFIGFFSGIFAGIIRVASEIDFIELLVSSFVSFVAVIFYGVVGMLLSVLKKDGRSQGISLGICFGTYIVAYLSTLNISLLKWCKWLSPMNFLDQLTYVSNKFNVMSLIAVLFIAVLMIYLANIIYKKKDL